MLQCRHQLHRQAQRQISRLPSLIKSRFFESLTRVKHRVNSFQTPFSLHRYYADNALKVVSIRPVADSSHLTEVVWGDQHRSVFVNAWLRDHCRCSECLDYSTQQRSFDSLLLPKIEEIRYIGAEHTDDKIYIRLGDIAMADSGSTSAGFQNAHTCEYSLEWLRSNCARDNLNVNTDNNKARAKAWDSHSLGISSANEQENSKRTEPPPHLRHVPTLHHGGWPFGLFRV